jgi:hypothetical protein
MHRGGKLLTCFGRLRCVAGEMIKAKRIRALAIAGGRDSDSQAT